MPRCRTVGPADRWQALVVIISCRREKLIARLSSQILSDFRGREAKHCEIRLLLRTPQVRGKRTSGENLTAARPRVYVRVALQAKTGRDLVFRLLPTLLDRQQETVDFSPQAAGHFKLLQLLELYFGLVNAVEPVEDDGIGQSDLRQVGADQQDTFKCRRSAEHIALRDLRLCVAEVEVDIVRVF